MKPPLRRTAKQAALSALVNGLRAPLTNLSAMSQTLASGRVIGRTVREYALMCAIEAIRLTRLIETFLTNEVQASPNLAENIRDFYAASSSELDGYASSFAHMRNRQPGMSPKKVRVKSTPAMPVTSLDPTKSRQRRGASTR
jgi:hypothetical protein